MPDSVQFEGASIGRRMIDISLSVAGLIVVAPALTVIGLAVWWEDGFPILFGQERIGQHARPFRLLKFRSMRQGANGPLVTARNDSRVTFLGRFLRRYKLDELPQLWNVLKGEMSFIGPRPEVSVYISKASPQWRRILAHRPGITDFATLLFRDEETLLARHPEPERYYVEHILPRKLALNVEYLDRRSLLSDIKVLLLSIRYSFFPCDMDARAIREAILNR